MTMIVPVKSNGQEITLAAPLAGGFENLPDRVQTAIVAFDVAYPAGIANMVAEDRSLRREVYAEAIAGFPGFMAIDAMKHLRVRNPRNPFAPTPQDVHEACGLLHDAWSGAVVAYASGNKWRGRAQLVFDIERARKYVITCGDPTAAVQWEECPPPWTDGCPLTPDVVRGMLRRNGSWQSALSKSYSGDFYLGELVKPLMAVSDEVFDRIRMTSSRMERDRALSRCARRQRLRWQIGWPS